MDAIEQLPPERSLTRTYAAAPERRKSFAELVRGLPVNDLGLPRFIYRTDMVPSDIFLRSQHEREEILTASVIEIDYVEGFPAFEDGQPIWSQLQFEDKKSYNAFVKYLEFGVNEGIRTVEQVAAESGIPLPVMMDYYYLYYWKARAKAYDLYVQALHERKRLVRLMRCEDDHYIIASKILDQCVDYFKNIDWESIDPAVVARMLPQLIEVQRKTVGASSSGGGEGNTGTPSVEVILRQMTRQDSKGEDGGIQKNSNLELLLTNPDAAAAAQELIIKLSGK